MANYKHADTNQSQIVVLNFGELFPEDHHVRRLRKKENIENIENIWYMADGVYSMYGDLSSTQDLIYLLDHYDNFYCYLDDAHGSSWIGDHGRGFVLESMNGIHEKMVVTASLNKSFACAGGALVLPNKEWKEKISLGGPPMVFSGPIPPPMLGAAVESAKIHLSDEIKKLQNGLAGRIQYFNELSLQLALPLVCDAISPIRYLNFKNIDTMSNIGRMLYQKGLYTNIVAYPIVPLDTPGIRIAITRKHRYQDIRFLLETISELLPKKIEKSHSITIQRYVVKHRELVEA